MSMYHILKIDTLCQCITFSKLTHYVNNKRLFNSCHFASSAVPTQEAGGEKAHHNEAIFKPFSVIQKKKKRKDSWSGNWSQQLPCRGAERPDPNARFHNPESRLQRLSAALRGPATSRLQVPGFRSRMANWWPLHPRGSASWPLTEHRELPCQPGPRPGFALRVPPKASAAHTQPPPGVRAAARPAPHAPPPRGDFGRPGPGRAPRIPSARDPSATSAPRGPTFVNRDSTCLPSCRTTAIGTRAGARPGRRTSREPRPRRGPAGRAERGRGSHSALRPEPPGSCRPPPRRRGPPRTSRRGRHLPRVGG